MRGLVAFTRVTGLKTERTAVMGLDLVSGWRSGGLLLVGFVYRAWSDQAVVSISLLRSCCGRETKDEPGCTFQAHNFKK